MSFVRSIARLGAANVVLLLAQSATIILLGVLGDAKAVGIYFLGQTTAQFVAAFATMRLDSAFPAARDRPELAALLVLAGASIMAATVALLCGLSLMSWLRLFEFQTLTVWQHISIGLLTAMIALQQLGRYWAIRHGQLDHIEHATYARAVAVTLLRGAVIAAIAFWEVHGIALASALLAVEVLLFVPGVVTLFPKLNAGEWRNAVRRRSLMSALRRNWKFPVIETPSTIIDSGTQNVPVYLVTQSFGLAATASFGLAYRAMAVPVGQLALAVTEAMQSRYSGWLLAERTAEMRRLFYRSSMLFAVLGVGGCLIAWALLEPLVVAVLGEKMRVFAELATVLTPWIAANVLVNANSRLIPLLKRQDLKLLYDFTSAGFLAATWAAQVWLHLPLTAFIALMAAGQTAAYLVYWLLIRHALLRAIARIEARSANR